MTKMKLALFGDSNGLKQLSKYIPKKNIILIVASYKRPEYISEIIQFSKEISVPYLVQPKNDSNDYPCFLEEFSKYKIDLIWVNSYSVLIQKDIINLTRYGGVNIHASYLPHNRGPNPIQWSIINGDDFTGVTLHLLDERFDNGNIIDQIKIPIKIVDTWLTIRVKILHEIENIIKRNLEKILTFKFTSIKQNELIASYNKRRDISNGIFEWNEPCINIYNKIRALISPLPGAYFYKGNKKIFINSFINIENIFEMKLAKYSPNFTHYQLNKLTFSISEIDIQEVNQFNTYFENNFKEYLFEYSLINKLIINFYSIEICASCGYLSINSISWEQKRCIIFISIFKKVSESELLNLLDTVSTFINKEIKIYSLVFFINKKSVLEKKFPKLFSLNKQENRRLFTTQDKKYLCLTLNS